MTNLNDSLTEIDWLNTLRIKHTKEIKNGITACLNNESKISEQSYAQVKYTPYDKPSYSYAYLIKLAIESSNYNRMKLSEIYEWIMDKYPYYRYMKTGKGKGWKNAIRHNLSLNKVFKRCPKNNSDSGKGSYWMIDLSCSENQIHDPPIKRMKIYNLIASNVMSSKMDVVENIQLENIQTILTSDALSPDNTINQPKSKIQLDTHHQVDLDSTPSSTARFISTKSAFTLNPSILKADCKIDIISNSFSDQSSADSCCTHNNICKLSEISSSTCEISYISEITDMVRKGYNHIKNKEKVCDNQLEGMSTMLPPENKSVTSSRVDLRNDNSINSSTATFFSNKHAFTLPSILKADRKIDIFSNSFSDQSAFVPYSIHNNICKASEISSSTCEISYSSIPKHSCSLLETPNYSNYLQRSSSNRNLTFHKGLSSVYDLSTTKLNGSLEIDSGDTGNGKNDIILKTPVLCQINALSDLKEKSEENYIIKVPKIFNGYKDDGCEAIFDNNNLQDSFFSIHRSLFESETCDSRNMYHPNHAEKRACKDISFSQNLLISTMSQYNNEHKSHNYDNHNLFEGSFGLSTNTKNILLNMSGLRENWSSSQWIELNEPNQEKYLTNDGHSNSLYFNYYSNQEGIIPSQEFLEMKNHLRGHRFKNDSESNKPSSVSTSSTLKSTDTVKSKSPACDKKTNAINSKDVTMVIDQVSKSNLSDEEDDIEDYFNWDSFL